MPFESGPDRIPHEFDALDEDETPKTWEGQISEGMVGVGRIVIRNRCALNVHLIITVLSNHARALREKNHKLHFNINV